MEESLPPLSKHTTCLFYIKGKHQSLYIIVITSIVLGGLCALKEEYFFLNDKCSVLLSYL